MNLLRGRWSHRVRRVAAVTQWSVFVTIIYFPLSYNTKMGSWNLRFLMNSQQHVYVEPSWFFFKLIVLSWIFLPLLISMILLKNLLKHSCIFLKLLEHLLCLLEPSWNFFNLLRSFLDNLETSWIYFSLLEPPSACLNLHETYY